MTLRKGSEIKRVYAFNSLTLTQLIAWAIFGESATDSIPA